MSRPRQLSRLAFALLLTSILPGCTAYATYAKCGFNGCPGDGKINLDVRALFDQHAVLQPPNILHIQTLDHVVYLSGLVDTDLERQLAESVAREATGVTRVVNSIGISNNGR
jgi:osmotically-inducible protein OsmY